MGDEFSGQAVERIRDDRAEPVGALVVSGILFEVQRESIIDQIAGNHCVTGVTQARTTPPRPAHGSQMKCGSRSACSRAVTASGAVEYRSAPRSTRRWRPAPVAWRIDIEVIFGLEQQTPALAPAPPG